MLSDAGIIEAMNQGNIVIDPYDKRQLGTNSYDCRLGEWYFRGNHDMRILHVDRAADMQCYWGTPIDAMHSGGNVLVAPGTTILAHTQEVVGGKCGYLAKMHCRSSIARSGLSVCRCAGVGDVGYIGRWTMEISNHTQTMIFIPVGYRICQMLFEYVGDTIQEYSGKYGKGEWDPYDMVPKPSRDWDRATLA